MADGMSRPNGQDIEELLQQTIARVHKLAPHLRWPRVAYHAKLNSYGSFYGTFYDAASNRRLDNSDAGPCNMEAGASSSPVGEASSTGEQQSRLELQQRPQPQHEPQPQRADTGTVASSPTNTVARPQQPHFQHRANGDVARLRNAAVQQPLHQQRQGPRGFNIPRPGPRARPAVAAAGSVGLDRADVESRGPSPTSSQAARSPDEQQQQPTLHPQLQQRRQAGLFKKQPFPEPETQWHDDPRDGLAGGSGAADASGGGADAAAVAGACLEVHMRRSLEAHRSVVPEVGGGCAAALVTSAAPPPPPSPPADWMVRTKRVVAESRGAGMAATGSFEPTELQGSRGAKGGDEGSTDGELARHRSTRGNAPVAARAARGDPDQTAAAGVGHKLVAPSSTWDGVEGLSYTLGGGPPVVEEGASPLAADAIAADTDPSAIHIANRQACDGSGAAERGASASPTVKRSLHGAAAAVDAPGERGGPVGSATAMLPPPRPHAGALQDGDLVTASGLCPASGAAAGECGTVERSVPTAALCGEPRVADDDTARERRPKPQAGRATVGRLEASVSVRGDNGVDVDAILLAAVGDGDGDADGGASGAEAAENAAGNPGAVKALKEGPSQAALLPHPSSSFDNGDVGDGDVVGEGCAGTGCRVMKLAGVESKAGEGPHGSRAAARRAAEVGAASSGALGSALGPEAMVGAMTWRMAMSDSKAGCHPGGDLGAAAAATTSDATTDAGAVAVDADADGFGVGDVDDAASMPQADLSELPSDAAKAEGWQAEQLDLLVKGTEPAGASPSCYQPFTATAASQAEEAAMTAAAAAEALVAETAETAALHTMLPPPTLQLPLPPPMQQQQLYSEWGTVPGAVSGRTPMPTSVNRRTSNISLQTLESGELPNADTPLGDTPLGDTPLGDTPSSILRPVGGLSHPWGHHHHQHHMASGPQRAAGRPSSLGSLLVLGTQGRPRGGSLGRSASGKLDTAMIESGELAMTLSEVVTPVAALLPPPPPPPPPEAAVAVPEESAAACATTEHCEAAAAAAANGGPDATAADMAASSWHNVKRPEEPLTGGGQDSGGGGRRRRWGTPIHAVAAAPVAAVAVDDAAAATPTAADAAQMGHVVDLSLAKGLVAHLSTHGSLQDVVPHIQAMSSVGGDSYPHAVPACKPALKRRSRSRSRSERSEQRSERESDRGREREFRGSRERSAAAGPAAATEAGTGSVEISAGARRGGAAAAQGILVRPSGSKSRSRSRERRRYSRSPRRRGSRSRSRSRSPVRDWRDKRNRGRAGDHDRNRELRDRDRCGRERGERERERDRDRERERDRDRERDVDRRGGGERYDGRYDGRHHDRSRNYGRATDRPPRGGRGGDARSGRGGATGSVSATACAARQATEPAPSTQNSHQHQQPSQQLMQQQRRVAAGIDGRAGFANGGGGSAYDRRSAAEARMESESAGSAYPHKRPHRDGSVATWGAGSASRGGSGSDMDLDDSDNEGPGEQNRPAVATAASTGVAAPGTTATTTTAQPPPPTRAQIPAASTSSLATATTQRRHGAAGCGIGFGQRHHARSAAAAAAAAAAATATGTGTMTHAGSSTYSPMFTGSLSPARTGGAAAAAATSSPPPPASGGAAQLNRATSPGSGARGAAAAVAEVAGAPAPGGGRQLGGGSRRPPSSQAPTAAQKPPNSQKQHPQKQQQQGAAATFQGKAERALAKLQQDRGRPQHATAGGGRGAPPAAGGGGGATAAKPRSGRDSVAAVAGGGGGGSGSGGGGGGAATTSSGLVASVLYDADAAFDPPGTARVGGDAPLSACMEPDLLGFLALSMIQFSCAYMVESPRSLFNMAHIKTLAEESIKLRRRADSNREANGNKWTTLQLTLYLQSALKSMESAYGHEQSGQEREAGMRTSLDLLSSASQMLAIVSHEANRLAQQLPRPPQLPSGGGGGGSTAAGGESGVTGSRAGRGGISDGGGGKAGGPPSTPPPAAKGVPGSPTNSARSLGMQTPSALGAAATAGAAAGGNRTPQHGGGGGTPLHPLAAAVAYANVGGPAPPADLLVLEAIRLLALKLNAICRTRWLLVNQDTLGYAIKLQEHGVMPAAPGVGGGGGGGDDTAGGASGAGGRRTSPAAAADSASSTLEAAALTASTYTASIQQMAESLQACAAAADAWRRAANEARTFHQAVSAPGVDPAAVVAAARIGALGYEGGLWDLMGSVNLARKALDSITGMI